MTVIAFTKDDGGRADAGFRGAAGDCVCRSIAIATGLPYRDVYARLAAGNAAERQTKRSGRSSGKRSARNGIRTGRKWFKDYMAELGFVWVSTSGIGQQAAVLGEMALPSVPVILSQRKHFRAVVDGVVRDTYAPRAGERVYGYWQLSNTEE